MIEHRSVPAVEEWITAAYHVTAGSREEADARARDVCLEQTVEFPDDLIPYDDIRENVVGRIESLDGLDGQRFEAVIRFPVETAGRELTQLVNVLFGNISIKPGIRLHRFGLPESLAARFGGPRFGRTGLRARVGVFDRPLLCTAIKPMGLSPAELAEMTYRLALGGIDLIKDDHGLADQPFCPFAERVERCAEAVRRANQQTGRTCLYLPNVTGPADRVRDRARQARQSGAGGVLFCPGLAGLDAMRMLADDRSIGLPILSHPAFQGSYSMSPTSGISHGALYGQLNRLAGADAAIFPNFGGRFSFSKDECRDLVDGTQVDMGPIGPIFPVPAGGMSLDRAGEMCKFYGRDTILLIGGDLHRYGGDLAKNCEKLVRLVEEAG